MFWQMASATVNLFKTFDLISNFTLQNFTTLSLSNTFLFMFISHQEIKFDSIHSVFIVCRI